MAQSQEIYKGLCDYLDGKKDKYSKNDEKLVVELQKVEDDFPINIVISVCEPISVLQFCSTIPYIVPEERRTDFAKAVCYVNNRLISGHFIFDIESGKISVRIVNNFKDSTFGPRLFSRLFNYAVGYPLSYGKKLVMFSEGEISLEDIFKFDE